MRFEWVKWKRNKKNLLLLVIALISIGIQLANQWAGNQRLDQEDFSLLKSLADEIQPPQGYMGPAEAYKLLQHSDETGHFYSANDQKQFERVSDVLYLLEAENSARNNGHSQEWLSVQTQRLALQKEYIDLGGTPWKSQSYEEIEQQLARNQWLDTHGIDLVDLDTDPQGAYFVYALLRAWMSLGLAVVLLGLFFFDFLSGEYERRTYLLMAVQPSSTCARYFRKMATAVLIAFGVFAAYLLAGGLLATTLFGTGSFDFPVMIQQGSGVVFRPLWEHLLSIAFVQLLFSVFLIQLIFVLAMWLKNSLEVLGIFLVGVLLPNLLAAYIPAVQRIGEWVALFYMDVDRFLKGSTGFHYPLASGVGVLLAGNLLLLFFNVRVVKKS